MFVVMEMKFVVIKSNMSDDPKDGETKGKKILNFCSVGRSACLH